MIYRPLFAAALAALSLTPVAAQQQQQPPPVLPPTAPQVAPEIRERLEKIATVNRMLKSYSSDIKITVKGGQGVAATSKIAFSRPSKARLESIVPPNTTIAVSDGTTVTRSDSEAKRFEKVKLTPNQSGITLAFDMVRPTPLPILQWLFQDEKAVDKILAPNLAAQVVVEESTEGDTPVVVFKLTPRPQPGASAEAKLVFDKASSLLRRVEVKVTEQGQNSEIIEEYVNPKADPELPETLWG